MLDMPHDPGLLIRRKFNQALTLWSEVTSLCRQGQPSPTFALGNGVCLQRFVPDLKAIIVMVILGCCISNCIVTATVL